MEVEVKLRLPDSASHQKLSDLLSPFHLKTHLQENIFFDGANSELSSKHAVLRLRFYNDDSRCVVSLKAKAVLVDGVSRVEEDEEDIDPSIGRVCVAEPWRLGAIDSSRVLKRVKDEFGVDKGFVCLGGFKNVRAVYDWKGLKLELDETNYDFGTSYEIECESEDPEGVKKLLEAFLKENGISYSYSEVSKFAVFRSGKLPEMGECSLFGRVNGSRHRGLKYSIDEDVAICKAVVMITKDEETGAAQRKEKYWERILNKFEMLYENRQGRTSHGISNRFGVISKGVLKYVGILKHFHKTRASSWTELDVVHHARIEYLSREKKPFAFEQCYHILQVMPKYNLHMIEMNNMKLSQEEGGGSNPVTPTASAHNINILTEGDQYSQHENNNTQPQPTTFLQRPPGMKAERRAKKLGASSSTYESMLEKTSSFINLFKERQAKRKLARDQQDEAMENFVQLKKRELDLKKEEEEDRIMAVDIESMPQANKLYWESRQQEILIRRGLLP